MKVILISPVRKLGKIGETVSVKKGFARNYLIPQELAIIATKANEKSIEQQKAEFESKNMQARLDAELAASSLSNQSITFIRQALTDGTLYGSVGIKEIAKEIKKLINCNVTLGSILLKEAIKSTGVFAVDISLHPEIAHISITINVARSDIEATEAFKNYKAATEIIDTPQVA